MDSVVHTRNLILQLGRTNKSNLLKNGFRNVGKKHNIDFAMFFQTIPSFSLNSVKLNALAWSQPVERSQGLFNDGRMRTE